MISPESGFSRPAIILSNVVFPVPDAPVRATHSPLLTVKERFFITALPSKVFQILFTSIIKSLLVFLE